MVMARNDVKVIEQMSMDKFLALIGAEGDKISVFIDGSNMFYLQLNMGYFFDPTLILSALERNFTVSNAFWYLARKHPQDQQAFLNVLINNGYTVRTKLIKEHWDPNLSRTVYKANMDIELAMDVADTKAHFDTMLLFSGDSDYVPVVERMRFAGKRVIVLSGSGMIGLELKNAADKYINLQALESLFKKNPEDMGLSTEADFKAPLQEIGYLPPNKEGDVQAVVETTPAPVEEGAIQRPILKPSVPNNRRFTTSRHSRHWK